MGVKMKRIVDVQIGQVKAGRGKLILQSKAIGSCLAIVAYDAVKNVGALAHIMLPGRSPGKKTIDKTKYAADAIDAIVSKMSRLVQKRAISKQSWSAVGTYSIEKMTPFVRRTLNQPLRV